MVLFCCRLGNLKQKPISSAYNFQHQDMAMINILPGGALLDNDILITDPARLPGNPEDKCSARLKTMAYTILSTHNSERSSPNSGGLRIKFDAMASHDITYVGIVQTARASGLTAFPVRYALTNCHNSLCAVGGTINEDDHMFGLSAAKKYGGDFVPAHLAVIHQYVREMMAGCGKMILGSDSHTRYGALGTLGIGEGGPELVKQLLSRTYDLPCPDVVLVWLEGAPRPGVGPQDVALALVKAVFAKGLVKNKILEFAGPGVNALSVDYRLGIDVMTTETTCLSSIWRTDCKVKEWLAAHGRESDYAELSPLSGAWYDLAIKIDLGKIEPMIALPFHPSNAWTIREFLANATDLLAEVEKEARSMLPKGAFAPNLRSKFKNGAFMADQGIVAGCSGGTYENLVRVAEIMDDSTPGAQGFSFSVYPASQPQYLGLAQSGHLGKLIAAGITVKTAFCGPCFGAGDVPANNAFSIRHTTRNFPSREGSKPSDGQLSYVALMDARSIAATAKNQGRLTPATELENPPAEGPCPYTFDRGIYDKRVYLGFGHPLPDEPLVFGPNIADWPAMPALPENLLLTVASAIHDPVTTTDELIPSGETSSYRSNPMRLAEFTLSRKDPGYVGRAKETARLERLRAEALAAGAAMPKEVSDLFAGLGLAGKETQTGIGSVVFALKPGDGSAREQAASCQKVLGGWANIAAEYATKRYRSNLVNWGMLPFIMKDAATQKLSTGAALFIPGIRKALEQGQEEIPAKVWQNGACRDITLSLPGMSEDERQIITTGCLINYYAAGK